MENDKNVLEIPYGTRDFLPNEAADQPLNIWTILHWGAILIFKTICSSSLIKTTGRWHCAMK